MAKGDPLGERYRKGSSTPIGRTTPKAVESASAEGTTSTPAEGAQAAGKGAGSTGTAGSPSTSGLRGSSEASDVSGTTSSPSTTKGARATGGKASTR